MELWEAAKEGDIRQVELLLGSTRKTEEKGGGLEGTPLHYAAFTGRTGIVEYLLQNKADVHCKAKDGSSPLHVASMHGDLKVVKLLLIKGSDITSRDNVGDNAFHRACSGGHTAVVDYLLQHGAENEIDSRNKAGYSPFHIACVFNNLSVVECLTNKGCDITSKTKDGSSGLQIAERQRGRNCRVAKYLRTKLQERQVNIRY